MTTVLDQFASEYQEYHDISPARRADQFRALDSLRRFTGAEPIECSPEQFQAWLRDLKANGLEPTTVKKYGMSARAFFGWAFDAGHYGAEDLMRIKRVSYPQAKPAVPRPYSEKEIKKLWPAIEKCYPLDPQFLKRWRRGTSRYKRIEHYAQHLQLTAVVRMALDCGLRRHEIFEIKLDDMHYDNAYIVVREGKGGKFREVPFTKTAKAAVKDWIEFRAELGPDHDRPWLSLTRIGPEGVWLRPMTERRFAIYLTDLDGEWQLHRLRHTCATTWLRAGMDIQIVSKLLGHASLEETKRYTELVRSDVQRQVEKHEDAFARQVA